MAVGRSGEIAATPWEGLEWDPELRAVYVEIRQSKVSKLKIIAFTCGSKRTNCWFLTLGDYLHSVRPANWTEAEDAYVFPDLHATGSPGTVLGNMIKALRPHERGGAAAYKNFAVPSLPDRVSAGGIRPGGCNFLAKQMPAEFIAHVSGHDLLQVGSLYNYIDANRTIALAGGLALAGWHPLPWGQLGEGPRPASLAALVDVGIDMLRLDLLMDTIFNLDSCSPPMLLQSGSNRPMVNVLSNPDPDPIPDPGPKPDPDPNQVEAALDQQYDSPVHSVGLRRSP